MSILQKSRSYSHAQDVQEGAIPNQPLGKEQG